MILHDKPGYWFLVWNPDLDPIFFFFLKKAEAAWETAALVYAFHTLRD